ncbi:MAG: hypothetical protein OEZ22_06395 [Spirochaetia bacterium]|nr:hypothetical protein [Spirochaetia bacterium]
MYPISEMVLTSSEKYLGYISRKTNFLITGGKKDRVQWFWVHLLKLYEENTISKILNTAEEKEFFDLLNNFGFIAASDITDNLISIEEKLPWVFKHPNGGIYIPLELIKNLMQEDNYLKKNYLFSLLKKIKLKEQKDFASLLGGSSENHFNITFENNHLDMALVLYIWFARNYIYRKHISLDFLSRGKIVESPYSFIRETKKATNGTKENILPKKPVLMWDYLKKAFGRDNLELEKWIYLLKEGKKGFFRSLSLASAKKSPLLEVFRTGLLLPIMPVNLSYSKSIEKIFVVTPSEVFSYIKQREQDYKFILQNK